MYKTLNVWSEEESMGWMLFDGGVSEGRISHRRRPIGHDTPFTWRLRTHAQWLGQPPRNSPGQQPCPLPLCQGSGMHCTTRLGPTTWSVTTLSVSVCLSLSLSVYLSLCVPFVPSLPILSFSLSVAGIPPGKSDASGGIWPTNLMLK